MRTVVSFREFAENTEPGAELIHSPFYPADLFEGDRAEAVLKVLDKDTTLKLRVWRISPLGVELLVAESSKSEAIVPGTRVDLSISLAKHTSEFHGLVVTTRHEEEGRALIGIRWCTPSDPFLSSLGSKPERRRSERWLCGVDFLPTGIAPNPLRFNDFVHFRVRDLSLEGMQLLASLRNKQLIPGMVLDSVVSLPMTGEVKFKLKIVNTRILCIDGRDYLSLGTTIMNPEEKLREILGQYIFQFGPKASVEELKAKGFRIKSMSSAMEFGYVRTAEDYREVLTFRRMAYSAVGKIKPNAAIEEVGDIFDTRARILTVRYRGELVASARVMFHSPEDQSEHEQFIALPEKFPRKDEIAEITRVCTHPKYRGSDLFYGITRHITHTVAQSNRAWLLGSAEEKLLGAYTRIGWKKTGVYFEHEDLGGIKHELLLGNLQQMLSGQGVEIALWNELYSDLSYYLKGREMVEFDPFMNLRMNVYASMAPLTKLFTRKLRNPKKKAG